MTDTSYPQRTASFYIKRITGIILLLAIAAVFLYSAISKLYALDPFTWTFMDMGIKNMMVASVIAHLFIGLEFAIALFLIAHIFLRSLTYPLTLCMLGLLTLYLLILIIKQGNTGSCGCFGEWIYMKPLTAIWKNLVLIAATVLLYFIYPVKPYKNQEWLAAIAGMAALVAPFIISPLGIPEQPEKTHEAIDLSSLYKSAPMPYVDLRTGKHIAAFMSLTCPHCRKAAYLLHIIHNNNPDLPIFIILNGPAKYESEFFKETHATDVPHLIFKNTQDFSTMAGPYVPAIYWINNSIIERKANYYQLDAKYMHDWLKE